MLHAATGDLKLDTGTLSVTTILDHDRGTSYNAQVGLNTPGAPGKLPGANLQGSYATHDTEQETRGTIGSGEIVIRDTAKQKQDVAKVNRDPEKAQVIVKDERAGVKVYVSTAAIKAIATTFEKTPVRPAVLIDAFEERDPKRMSDPEYRDACDISDRLKTLGGGTPTQQNSPKGATQFIFPNGMVVRFDLQPGQYLAGQVPHINIEWPGTGINHHIDLKP